MTSRLRIAALGSSFAAGPSIGRIEDEAAGRSSRNYSHQLAQRLGANLDDLTVSGATVLNVLSEQQVVGNRVFDPQLDHLPKDADIVTFTCGGNDLNYVGSLINDSLRSCLGSRHPSVSCGSSDSPVLGLEQLTSRITDVLDKIHYTIPHAKVYLVQYLAIVGNDTRPMYDLPLTAEHLKHHDYVARLLAQAYEDAASKRPQWTKVVRVAAVSREKHALGSLEPWIRGFSFQGDQPGQAPYHPNLAGHTAIAEMVYQEHLKSE